MLTVNLLDVVALCINERVEDAILVSILDELDLDVVAARGNFVRRAIVVRIELDLADLLFGEGLVNENRTVRNRTVGNANDDVANHRTPDMVGGNPLRIVLKGEILTNNLAVDPAHVADNAEVSTVHIHTALIKLEPVAVVLDKPDVIDLEGVGRDLCGVRCDGGTVPAKLLIVNRASGRNLAVVNRRIPSEGRGDIVRKVR